MLEDADLDEPQKATGQTTTNMNQTFHTQEGSEDDGPVTMQSRLKADKLFQSFRKD